jgi:ABC-type multidrug transport system fused ATPase/permease subunit
MIGPTLMWAAKPVGLLLQAMQTPSNQMTPEQQFEIAREALRHGQGALELIVPLSFFTMIVLIVWLGTRRRQAQIQAQAELRKQLIDKFGSLQELTAFLESKGGRQFFGDLQLRSRNQLRYLPGGLVLTMLGLAFLALTLMRRNLIIPAAISLALGVGLLISAAIAHKMESKNNDASINPGSGMQSLPPG